MTCYLRNKIDSETRMQGNGDMTGHPDSQVSHDPVGAVGRQQANATAGWQLQTCKVASSAARLLANLGPGQTLNTAVRQRLNQIGSARAQGLLT